MHKDVGNPNRRWGSPIGSVYLQDQKLPIRGTRVRNGRENAEVPMYSYERFQAPRKLDEGLFLRVLRKGLLALALTIPGFGLDKADAVTVNTGPNILSGGALQGGQEAAIYSVELTNGGERLISVGVRVNSAGSTALQTSDIAALRLYADANLNGVFEQGVDTFLGDVTTVPVGTMVAVADPTPSENLGGGTWFFVTVQFLGSAGGKRFTVEAATPPDNIRTDPPGAPPLATADGGIGPGASILIRPSGSVSVGLEPLVGIALIAFGVYWLSVRSSKRPAD